MCQVRLLLNVSGECVVDLWCSGKQFDVDDAILNALKGLQVDLAVDASVKLDDCKAYSQLSMNGADSGLDPSDLAFVQKGVTANASVFCSVAHILYT